MTYSRLTQIEENKVRNKAYYVGLQRQVEEMLQSMQEQLSSKEARWRALKHEQVLVAWSLKIKERQYQAPQDRHEAVTALDGFLQSVFQRRRQLLQSVHTIPLADLRKPKLQKYLEDVGALYDEVQLDYDRHITG